MKYLDLEHRILRYLAKVELNLDNPIYMDNPHLKKCFNGADLDMEKVRQHFKDRGILLKCNATEQDFDDVVAKLRLDKMIDNKKFKASKKCKDKHTDIEADREVIMVDWDEKMKKLSKKEAKDAEENSATEALIELLNTKEY